MNTPNSRSDRDHAAIGTQYCRDIVDGTIWVSKWVKLACQRHLNGIENQGTTAFPFRFNVERANRVCRFVELFKIFEGPLAGQRLDLQPWQSWLLTDLFGWEHAGGDRDGLRRFRSCYIEVPRGQGKSALASALALYMSFADSPAGNQVVCAGTSRDVAKIVLSAAQEMARREPKFMRSLGVEVLAHRIVQKRTASRMWAISADARKSDGLNLSAFIADELHLHRDRKLFDSLVTGLGKRPESMGIAITTAGTDSGGICFEQHSYLKKVLEGSHTDHTTFGVLYTVPEGFEDDWNNPAVWRACNPGWGVTVDAAKIGDLANTALASPSSIANFKTKHLGLWCNADSPWVDMTRWRSLTDPALTIDQFLGQPCYIALDIAYRTDLCGKSYVFKREIDGQDHHYVFTRAYLPEAAIKSSKTAQYPGWVHDGHIVAHPGEVIDYAAIEEDLLDDCRRFEVRSIAYDPWNAQQFAQRMLAQGLPMIELRMNVQNLSEPMKEIEALMLQARLHHNDPVLDWCVSNVRVVADRNDNIFPRKDKPEQKIDLAVASIMSMALAMEYGFEALTGSFVSFF